jgi:hypothetical protein
LLEGSGHPAAYESRFASYGREASRVSLTSPRCLRDLKATETEDRFVRAGKRIFLTIPILKIGISA